MALWSDKQEGTYPAGAGAAAGQFPDRAPRADGFPPEVGREERPVSQQGSELLLGPGVEFDGKLTFRGTLLIDARFTGAVVTDDVLIVGEHATMNAEITCGTLVVHGEVNGNVRASAGVELRGTGRLRGDVVSPGIVMERGALLQGSVKIVEKSRR